MTTDQITPEQKAASAAGFFPEFWESYGWGFGVAINTRRDNLWATPGRDGWDGGYGTSWYVDPAEELIGVLMTQRVWDEPVVPPMAIRDFWTSVYPTLARGLLGRLLRHVGGQVRRAMDAQLHQPVIARDARPKPPPLPPVAERFTNAGYNGDLVARWAPAKARESRKEWRTTC
jgi:CubicO group peptidase (beta-lactamase class C family)